MSKKFIEEYSSEYYVRVVDINANEGMTISSVFDYFQNAIKDNNKYLGCNLKEAKVRMLNNSFPKNVRVITKVYSTCMCSQT
jgi:hypothetical protein